MRTKILIASALLLASPLAFSAIELVESDESSFVSFTGTCEHKEDPKAMNQAGTLEIKAKCDGFWSFSGSAEIDDTYADGGINASSAGSHTCNSEFYGPWYGYKKHKLECEGTDEYGLKTSIKIEITTKTPKTPK